MSSQIQQLKKILRKREQEVAANSSKKYHSESSVPEYATHNSHAIKGFFGEYRFLSNFYPCPNGIWYEGLKFPTTEHAYQAAKVNTNDRESFLTCNVKEVKRLGGSISIGKEKWDNIKYNVMAQLVLQKFATHDDLRNRLIETGNAYLEETNHWHDKTWGVCDGDGLNWLGKILMNVREFWK